MIHGNWYTWAFASAKKESEKEDKETADGAGDGQAPVMIRQGNGEGQRQHAGHGVPGSGDVRDLLPPGGGEREGIPGVGPGEEHQAASGKKTSPAAISRVRLTVSARAPMNSPMTE